MSYDAVSKAPTAVKVVTKRFIWNIRSVIITLAEQSFQIKI